MPKKIPGLPRCCHQKGKMGDLPRFLTRPPTLALLCRPVWDPSASLPTGKNSDLSEFRAGLSIQFRRDLQSGTRVVIWGGSKACPQAGQRYRADLKMKADGERIADIASAFGVSSPAVYAPLRADSHAA